MSYNAEKKQAEYKWQIAKRIALFVMLGIVCLLCMLSAFCPADTWKYYLDLPQTGARKRGEMRIHFVDVGQGDCTVIELPDGKIMLIDGGAENTASVNGVMRYLNALKVEKIDYLVVTHADADHCGGLDTVVKHKKISRAFLPADEPLGQTEYAEVYSALRQKSVPIELSQRNAKIQTDGYTLSFLSPTSAEEGLGGNNEDSAVIWLDYKGVSALFTGDATAEVENRLIQEDKVNAFSARGVALNSTEILKVAHHGSDDATSESFLSYLGVQTSVISCGVGNAYGHPTAKVLQRLENTEIYRTDSDGSVMITIKATGEYSVKKIGK